MPWVFNPFTGKLDQTAAAGGGSQVNSDWNATSGVSQILNKPTIPAATTDASLLTSGTLADARLSANVSLDNQNNNFSASQTFQGTANTAPNQTAASGSSLMTRDLVAERLWQFINPSAITTPLNTFMAVTANSGQAITNGQSARVSTSATVIGSAASLIMLGGNGAAINRSNGGLGGANLTWARPWVYTFQTSRPLALATTANLYFKITKVAQSNTPTYNIPNTEICCGFRIYGNASSPFWPNFQAFTCNGTTLTTAGAITNAQVDDTFPIRVVCNGSGSITFAFYKIGTGWVTIGSVATPELNQGGYTFQINAVSDGVTASSAAFSILGNPTFMNLDTLT
jgi:hypothetical protein